MAYLPYIYIITYFCEKVNTGKKNFQPFSKNINIACSINLQEKCF